MPLTADQITRIRNEIGDVNTDEPELADARLNTIFAEESDDFGATIVRAAYELSGIYASQVDTTGEYQNEVRSQRHRNLEDRIIPRLERRYGEYAGTISPGSIDLNINTDYDDLD